VSIAANLPAQRLEPAVGKEAGAVIKASNATLAVG